MVCVCTASCNPSNVRHSVVIQCAVSLPLSVSVCSVPVPRRLPQCLSVLRSLSLLFENESSFFFCAQITVGEQQLLWR